MLSESESLVFTLPIASSIIIVIFSYSVFIAAFLVTISIFSKSIKEAQSYLSLLSIIPSVIGILVMSSPEKIQSFFPLTIPIYNVIYLLKMLLGNSIDWNNCIIACASLFAYTFILLKLCSIMLKSEKYIM